MGVFSPLIILRFPLFLFRFQTGQHSSRALAPPYPWEDTTSWTGEAAEQTYLDATYSRKNQEDGSGGSTVDQRGTTPSLATSPHCLSRSSFLFLDRFRSPYRGGVERNRGVARAPVGASYVQIWLTCSVTWPRANCGHAYW